MLLFPPDLKGRVVKIYDALAVTGDLDKFRSPQDAVDVIDDILRRLDIDKMTNETNGAKARAEDYESRLASVREHLESAGYAQKDTDRLEHRYVAELVDQVNMLETFVESLKDTFNVVDDKPIDGNVTMALLETITQQDLDLAYLRASLRYLAGTPDGTSDDNLIVALRDRLTQFDSPAAAKKRWWKRGAA